MKRALHIAGPALPAIALAGVGGGWLASAGFEESPLAALGIALGFAGVFAFLLLPVEWYSRDESRLRRWVFVNSILVSVLLTGSALSIGSMLWMLGLFMVLFVSSVVVVAMVRTRFGASDLGPVPTGKGPGPVRMFVAGVLCLVVAAGLAVM